MRTVTRQQPITLEDLRAMATRTFGDMVKAVVDIDRGLMIVDAEMHADQEAELLEARFDAGERVGDQPLSGPVRAGLA